MTLPMAKLSLPTGRDWLFTAKTFAASMLALYIALAAGLPRPYWAMATVYIVANPLSGATRSKALFRVCGTAIGAAAAVFFTPVFVDAPILMCLVVAVWTGSLLFVSFLDRSPRSYLFMLSGYTLPLIALPTVGDPARIFDVATARAIEIALGIICTSLVHSLVLPARVGPVVGDACERWLGEAKGWLGAVLRTRGESPVAERAGPLAADMVALDGLIAQLSYDPAMGVVVSNARALRARMSMLMPLASSLADRLAAVHRTGTMPAGLAEASAELDRLLVDFRVDSSAAQGGQRRGTEAIAGAAAAMHRRITAARTALAGSRDWSDILAVSALERMSEVVDLWQDCTVLAAEVRAGRRARRRPPLAMDEVWLPKPHFDWPMLIFSAASAMGATFVAGLVWIYSGWAQGSAFVMIAAVVCSFFATADTPAPMIRMFIKWTVAAATLAGVYIFAVLPGITSYADMVAVFASPLLLLGLLITRPQTMFIGMLGGVNFATLMMLQDTYSANFASFANSALAIVGGGVYAYVWMTLVRPFGAAFVARRLLRAGWREIAQMADDRRERSPFNFLAGRTFDRLGQLVPRLAAAPTLQSGPGDILAEMRAGLNVVAVSKALATAPQPLRTRLGAVLDAVRTLFTERADLGRRTPADPRLMERIDEALRDLLAEIDPDGARGEPATNSRSAANDLGGREVSLESALSGLVGLRLALFPEASAPDLPTARERLETVPIHLVAAE